MELLNDLLLQRINEVKSRIEKAAEKSGRKPEDIKLIGVTKYTDSETVKKAISLGMTDFAENRVQNLVAKYDDIPEAAWHFIGRLQTNKVKYIVDKVKLIHSLDRLSLAEEIDRAAGKKNVVVNVLVQVNVGREASKAGIEPDECEKFMNELSKFNNIKVKGLMTIAPFINKREQISRIFAEINKLFVDIARKNLHNISMEYLSAGMTNDFEAAIEEGANMIRIGTALFKDV